MKVPLAQGTDGRWYAKPKSAGGGSTKAPENLRAELDKWYFDKIDGEYDGPAAAKRVGNWFISRKARFTNNGKVNLDAIENLLTDVIGGPSVPIAVLEFLDRYVTPDGSWK